MTFEIEQKYHIEHLADVEQRLGRLGATEQSVEKHQDTYFNHPCRDFAETSEAFRLRRVDGVPMVTYKGPKLPGAVKARQELEWQLAPGDADGSKMEQLLDHLGFRQVAIVRKTRRPFSVTGDLGVFSVVLDEVETLGWFAEVERIVEDASQIESARASIADIGTRLGLRQPESRSYLAMVLEGLDPPVS